MDYAKHMESNCKTPTKKLITFHGLLAAHQAANHCETPPARPTKVKNPFEHVLHEHLGTNFISPTLFAKKTPVKKDFSWTIDELSELKPAEIDAHSSDQFGSPTSPRDDLDAMVQSRIDSYFSMQQILPSPMQPCEGVPLMKASPAPVCTSSTCTQTMLSLPPRLPEEVERVLQPYFNFNHHQSQQDVLYTRLFDSPGTPQVEADLDLVANDDCFDSPVKNSPRYKHSTLYQRTIGTPGNFATMNECPFSPIVSGSEVEVETEVEVERERNFSQVMSVDGSFNVPDCSQIEKHNHSQLDSSQHSSEGLSTSTMNWDLEYKQMSSPLPHTHIERDTGTIETMEMSRLNTPKQRLIHSQRKKLSDSFGAEVHSDGDGGDGANDEDYMMISQQSNQSTRSRTDERNESDQFESGYQTNSLSFEQGTTARHCFAPRLKSADSADSTARDATSLWASVDVVSSTPTKRK